MCGSYFPELQPAFQTDSSRECHTVYGSIGQERETQKDKAYELLEKVGLDKDEADRRILKLSGGQ